MPSSACQENFITIRALVICNGTYNSLAAVNPNQRKPWPYNLNRKFPETGEYFHAVLYWTFGIFFFFAGSTIRYNPQGRSITDIHCFWNPIKRYLYSFRLISCISLIPVTGINTVHIDCSVIILICQSRGQKQSDLCIPDRTSFHCRHIVLTVHLAPVHDLT